MYSTLRTHSTLNLVINHSPFPINPNYNTQQKCLFTNARLDMQDLFLQHSLFVQESLYMDSIRKLSLNDTLGRYRELKLIQQAIFFKHQRYFTMKKTRLSKYIFFVWNDCDFLCWLYCNAERPNRRFFVAKSQRKFGVLCLSMNKLLFMFSLIRFFKQFFKTSKKGVYWKMPEKGMDLVNYV